MTDEHAKNVGAPALPNPLEIYCPVCPGERVFQGEVIERILEWTAGYNEKNPDEVVGAKPNSHKLAIVLTQDCDLVQDWNDRKSNLQIESDLRSVLLCPAFPAEELRGRQDLRRHQWEVVRQNKNERYAYLADIPSQLDATKDGHAAILIDLTNYFTVRTVELYRQLRSTGNDAPRRRCRLNTPWREHLQCRFAAYQCRIGLPQDHFIPESRRTASPGGSMGGASNAASCPP